MVVMTAPAKLTVSLRVVGVRDDGMHLIDAEMFSVSLCDTIRIDEQATPGVTMSGVGAAELDTLGPDNLVARALRLAGRTAHVSVDKQIPPGAGLGGGSSDAAAILRWAGFDDVTRAGELGADVVFCLLGGRARVSGIGEIVEPRRFENRVFTLLTPPVHCSTPDVYRRWDEMGGPVDRTTANDLMPAALDLYPELEQSRRLLADASSQTPRLAGSGGTWFVEGAFPGEGRRVVETFPSV